MVNLPQTPNCQSWTVRFPVLRTFEYRSTLPRCHYTEPLSQLLVGETLVTLTKLNASSDNLVGETTNHYKDHDFGNDNRLIDEMTILTSPVTDHCCRQCLCRTAS